MRTVYSGTIKPNAFIVIRFTAEGPKNVGQFSSEGEARKAYLGCYPATLMAQRQVNPALGAKGGQDLVWSERNF